MSTGIVNATEVNPIHGTLDIKLRNRAGDTVFQDSGPNMIMTATKAALASFIAGDGQNKVVSYIGLGNNAATPSPSDTMLGGIVTTSMSIGENRVNASLVAYLKAILTHSYPAEGRVTFTWTVDFSEANGLSIYEFGLICSDYSLFSRKTRGVIYKNSDLAIDGNWTIIF